MILSPDCRDENHQKCDGTAFDLDKDDFTVCQCRDLSHGAQDDPHAVQDQPSDPEASPPSEDWRYLDGPEFNSPEYWAQLQDNAGKDRP